jgi:hypothetical protein
MFAYDLCPSQIEYFSLRLVDPLARRSYGSERNSIDLNRKDRASLLRRKGYEGQERYHKSSIFNSGLSGLGLYSYQTNYFLVSYNYHISN